jgi:hypothetical protein
MSSSHSCQAYELYNSYNRYRVQRCGTNAPVMNGHKMESTFASKRPRASFTSNPQVLDIINLFNLPVTKTVPFVCHPCAKPPGVGTPVLALDLPWLLPPVSRTTNEKPNQNPTVSPPKTGGRDAAMAVVALAKSAASASATHESLPMNTIPPKTRVDVEATQPDNYLC